MLQRPPHTSFPTYRTCIWNWKNFFAHRWICANHMNCRNNSVQTKDSAEWEEEEEEQWKGNTHDEIKILCMNIERDENKIGIQSIIANQNECTSMAHLPTVLNGRNRMQLRTHLAPASFCIYSYAQESNNRQAGLFKLLHITNPVTPLFRASRASFVAFQHTQIHYLVASAVPRGMVMQATTWAFHKGKKKHNATMSMMIMATL